MPNEVADTSPPNIARRSHGPQSLACAGRAAKKPQQPTAKKSARQRPAEPRARAKQAARNHPMGCESTLLWPMPHRVLSGAEKAQRLLRRPAGVTVAPAAWASPGCGAPAGALTAAMACLKPASEITLARLSRCSASVTVE